MDVEERRQQARQERASNIIEAAERVFASRGILPATMDQIAQEAGVSKGALYRYFTSKDELYLTIAMGALEGICARLELLERHCEHKSGYDWFRGNLGEVMGYAQAHPTRFQVAFGTSASGFQLESDSELFHQFQVALARTHTFGERAMQRGQRDGSLRPELDVSTTLFHVWASIVGVHLFVAQSEEIERRVPFEIDLSHLLETHIDVLMQGLRAIPQFSGESGPTSPPGEEA